MRDVRLPALLLLLVPSAALAHPGHHETFTFLEDVKHLLTEPDHLLAAAVLVALSVGGGAGWALARRRVRK